MKKKKKTETHDQSTNKSLKLSSDRLSNLSDDLICHILSYTDTKLAVQTCVLSKRWRHSWEYIPSWNIHGNSKLVRRYNQFFISKLFENHKALKLYSLSLHDTKCLGESLVNRVIEHAALRQVQHVHLKSDSPIFTEILLCVRKYLMSLKLEDCSLFVDPSCLKFPCLKTLSLHNVFLRRHPSNVFLPRHPLEHIDYDAFSSCVSLENLELNQCSVACWGDFIISCPKLVTLKVSNMWLCNSSPPENRCLIVSAPRLAYFNFEIAMDMDLILSINNSSVPHTVNFSTCFNYNIQKFSRKYKERCLSKLVNLFEALRTAKSLNISIGTVEVLSAISDMLENQICPFGNLEKVKLRVREGVNLPLEAVKRYLLSGSPNVKEIDVEEM